MPFLLSRRAGFLLATAALVPGSGCSPGGSGLGYDLDKLPPYEGDLARLFNNTIEPAAFGLGMAQSGNLQFDPDFRKRAQDADVVSTLRVTTLTASKADDKTNYTLQFESIRDFKGTFEDDLRTLAVSERLAQPYSIVSAVQARARGRTLVGFWKRFREQNRMSLHFHFFPDSDDTTKAIQDSLALEELKK